MRQVYDPSHSRARCAVMVSCIISPCYPIVISYRARLLKCWVCVPNLVSSNKGISVSKVLWRDLFKSGREVFKVDGDIITYALKGSRYGLAVFAIFEKTESTHSRPATSLKRFWGELTKGPQKGRAHLTFDGPLFVCFLMPCPL